MERDKALEVLKDVREALFDFLWWLEAGTLLGAVREDNFIEHDPNDIDISVLIPDHSTEIDTIDREMKERGFVLYKKYGRFVNGLQLVYKRDGIKVDLFFNYEGLGGVWHAVWKRGEMKRNIFPWSVIFPIKPGEINGIEVPVPQHPQEHLALRYGDWRTPAKEWDYWTDPLCLE